MPRKNTEPEFAALRGRLATSRQAPIMVSGRWMISALVIVVLAAILCAWGTLCLLYWQGAWQLLYRPTSVVTRTPAAAGLDFSPVAFATTSNGGPRIHGWWIPEKRRFGGARSPRYTVIYLHGSVGNLSDCVDDLAAIHEAGVNILAFDYRGYGQSQFVHPSEARWREDTDWAISYVAGDRQIPPQSIVLLGTGLGANLALEAAAAHPELGGVVLDSPIASPVAAAFQDARARLVPAHMLFRDRYDMAAPAGELSIPSLWMEPKKSASGVAGDNALLSAYRVVNSRKALVQLPGDTPHAQAISADLRRWLPTLRESR
jgi:pimeloyl-ACP methyl ester carboxylesterase